MSNKASGSNVQVTAQFEGDATIYPLKITGESLQDETTAIDSASLEADKKFKEDSIAVQDGQAGNLEIEVFDSDSSQILLHAMNGTPSEASAIKNALIISFRGSEELAEVRIEGGELNISLNGVDVNIDISGTYAETIALIKARTGWGAELMISEQSEYTKTPANLKLLDRSFMPINDTTKVAVKSAEGYQLAIIADLDTVEKGLLSYPGSPRTFKIQKGFEPITKKFQWENNAIASATFTVDQKAALTASLSILGGTGQRIASVTPATGSSKGDMFVSTNRSNQFLGGISRPALQASLEQNNNLEKLTTFQGISEGTERTGNIDLTVGTTLRFTNEVDEEVLQNIENGTAQDYLLVLWTQNKAKEEQNGFKGLFLVYVQKVKSGTAPAPASTGPGVVQLQPSYSALNPAIGEGVMLFTQGKNN